MKYLLYVVLILVMSVQIKKGEETMAEITGNTRRLTTVVKPTTPVLDKGERDNQTKRIYGPPTARTYGPPEPPKKDPFARDTTAPAWLGQTGQNLINPIAPAWLGQTGQRLINPTPPSWTDPNATRAPSAFQPPAWLGALTQPITGPTAPQSRFNPLRRTGQGQAALPVINPNMPSVPTGSFLAADGSAVQNTNQQAYWLPQNMAMYPTGTFFAGGGSQVAGGVGGQQVADNGGNGSGFGTNYGWGGGYRRGGGGGGWTDYGNGNAQWPADMGLFQWNYKG